jgi:hypothetical protein
MANRARVICFLVLLFHRFLFAFFPTILLPG